MQYEYIIFDADHTILDFNADERRAFRAAFRAAGVPADEEMIEACWAFSARNWGDLGLYNVHLPEIQRRYHALYYDHVRDIMQFADASYGLGAGRAAAERAFLHTLSSGGHCVDGARETIAALCTKYRVCVATNGLTAMQTGRLQALSPMLYRVFISEQVGAIKPTAAFFGGMVGALNTAPARCLMVGDSLASDAAGANAAGMDCVWFNAQGAPLPSGYRVRAVVRALNELLPLLLGPSPQQG